MACTVMGLSNGTAYTFTVTATNAIGTSPSSSPSAVVIPTVPQVLTSAMPTVTGGSKPGYVKSAIAGAWGPSPVALTYRWSRVSSHGVITPIAGANGRLYRVTNADVGYRLTVAVTGTKVGYTTVSRASAQTSVISGWRH
ncbi:hypothetical protein [Knoellia flava]|uniref:hypothetical protein n=1 Tax=Knoellia flava TaxID=913969 RepID=UPI0039F02D56